jgi:hypothetical protein
MWCAEEFLVLHGKYTDTQPQRYLETQPIDKRKKGFLSGLRRAAVRSASSCWWRGCTQFWVPRGGGLGAPGAWVQRRQGALNSICCCLGRCWQAMRAKEILR